MSDFRFRDRLDSELEHIKFTDRLKKEVLERSAGQQKGLDSTKTHSNRKAGRTHSRTERKMRPLPERLYLLLNTELRIPVKPVVVALLVTVSGLIFTCADTAGVSAEEIRKSRIEVVETKNGGQPDDIYKNQG